LQRSGPGYEKYRHDFAKLIWQIASPKWNFDDATFDRSAASLNNPDHVAIVTIITAGGLAWLKASRNMTRWKRLAEAPIITVPTITLEGDANGAPHPEPNVYVKKSPADMRIAPLTVASATTYLKKRRKPLPTLSSKLIVIESIYRTRRDQNG